MAQILIRNLDDALVARLKERARQNHRSLQAEVKALLEQAAGQATDAEVEAILERWRLHWGDRHFSDSADLIRELRDERLVDR